MVQRPRPTVPPALPPDGWLPLQPPHSVSAGERPPGLRNAALAWTPVGAGGWLCWQEATEKRCQAEQAAEWDHGALGLAGPPLWRGGLCGSLMWPRHRSDAPPPPHPKSHIGSPSQGPLLTGPLHPPSLPTQVHLCLHTTPCPAAAVFPEYVCHLTHGRAVTWFWMPGQHGAEAKVPGRHPPVV